MNDVAPIVFLIDDDDMFRKSTERLIRSAGFNVQAFISAGDFLKNPKPQGPACLVLDVRMPGLSGMDLQRELIQSRIDIPIIFITGHGDIPMSVRAMKAGATEFLTKPFKGRLLLDAVRAAIEKNREALQKETEIQNLAATLRPSHSARARGYDSRCRRFFEQTSRRQTQHDRGHD